MEVIEEPLVLKLISFIENDDVRRAIILPEAFEQLVVGRRLSMDSNRLTQAVEKLIQHAVLRVVLPAIYVLNVDVEDSLAKLLERILGDTCLASTGWTEEDGRVGGILVDERFEHSCERVDFAVTMLDVTGNEVFTQHTSIRDHGI
jgi:hypothetical protein